MNEQFELERNVHTLRQRKSALSRLKHLPNHESFDVEFSPMGKVLQITNYNGAEVPIGTERFEYGESGRVRRSVALDSAGEETYITEFEYAEGSQVAVTSDRSEELTSRTVTVYEGDLVLSIATFDSADRPKIDRTFQYVEGRLAESVSNFYLSDGSLNERCICSYDSRGRVTETFGLKADGTPLGDGRYRHEYDTAGRLSRVWTFNEFSGENTAVRVYEYSCDEHGNWIERREFHRWRKDVHWSKEVTSRKLTYYPTNACEVLFTETGLEP